MKKKEKKVEQQEVVPIEELDKSVISSEEVGEVISGDEVALAEQMERTKALTKEQQLEAIKNAKIQEEAQKKEEEARIQKEKRIQEEVKRRLEKEKAEEEARKEAARLQEEAKLAEQKAIAVAQASLKKEEEAKKIEEQKKAEEAQRKMAEQKAEENLQKKIEEQKPINAEVEQKTNVTSETTQNNNDNTKSDEPSTFKRVMAVILFLSFFAIVYFLPEISNIIENFQESRKEKPIIIDGTSTCELSRTSDNLDINTIARFTIIDSKLRKLEYITTSKGNKVEDEEELKKLNNDCETLKLEAGELKGVSISCSLSNGTNTTRQKLDFDLLDVNEVQSAYIEAGGVYPEFKKSDNIDEIESKLISSGYKCTRS